MTSILELALKHAVGHSVSRIVRINVKVGELSDLEPEWMQNYFNYVSKNTIAENAQLVIDRIPIVMACNRCQYSFAIKREEFIDMKCPECENRDCRLISGKEYFVENMEVL